MYGKDFLPTRIKSIETTKKHLFWPFSNFLLNLDVLVIFRQKTRINLCITVFLVTQKWIKNTLKGEQN